MNLDPARGRRNVLSVVLGAPALHKGHPNGAHLGELVDGLEPVVHALGQQGRKLLVIENFEAAARRDLAYRGGMETVVVVAVPRLHKDGGIRETFRVHLTPDIVQVYTFAYMPASVFNGGVSVHIRQLPQTKSIIIFI